MPVLMLAVKVVVWPNMVGLLLAALVVLGGVVFELIIVGRKPESIKVKVAQPVTA